MSYFFPDHVTTRTGNARGSRCAAALANFSRHTSRDTVLVACSATQSYARSEKGIGHLTSSDIDGLSEVIDDLGARDLDLVLHGSGGGLEAAAELVALLRGRYHSIRALVPEAALSALSLIAFVCDSLVMPESALLGLPHDSYEPHLETREAVEWVASNGTHPNASNRVEITTRLFDEDAVSSGPITARYARDLGLQIPLVCDRSGVGSDLEAIGQAVENTLRAEALVKLIENHRGFYYAAIS
jgi:hypothetical protein